MRLLVVGARPASLGAHVAGFGRVRGYTVTTAGIEDEDIRCDAASVQAVRECMDIVRPHHVVCTVGRNLPGTIQGKGWYTNMKEQMQVNYLAPMIIVSEFTRMWRQRFKDAGDRMDREWGDMTLHCVAISSNSAYVARSKSGGYCASKAALTMGYRAAAREQAEHPFSIYTYEPGWLDGTPMSAEVEARMDMPPEVLQRIPGDNLVDPDELAGMIVNNLSFGRWLNGTSLRVDGGDQ